MPFILRHQTDPEQFLEIDNETCIASIVTVVSTGKKKLVSRLASRFPTEAAAIVALEDSDFQGDFYPDYVKA